MTTFHTYSANSYEGCPVKQGFFLPQLRKAAPGPPIPANKTWDQSIQPIDVPGNRYDVSVKYKVVYFFDNGKKTFTSGETSEIPTKGIGMPLMRFDVPTGATKIEIYRQVNNIYSNNSMGSLYYAGNMRRFYGEYTKVASFDHPKNTVWLDNAPICM